MLLIVHMKGYAQLLSYLRLIAKHTTKTNKSMLHFKEKCQSINKLFHNLCSVQ